MFHFHLFDISKDNSNIFGNLTTKETFYQFQNLVDKGSVKGVSASLFHHGEQDGVTVVVHFVDVYTRLIEQVLGDSDVTYWVKIHFDYKRLFFNTVKILSSV
jgi:hypothetical protein